MQRAQPRAGEAGGENSEPWRAGEIGNAVGAHRAHHQRSLEPEIDAAASLGDAFPQAHEQEWRGDADGAAEHRERYGPEPDRSVSRHIACLSISPATLPATSLSRLALEEANPSVDRVARQHE